MKINDYQEACKRTAGGIRHSILCLGLFGEAGELADLIKKIEGHGHKPDKDRLTKEIGDIFWYCAILSYVFNVRLHSTMGMRENAEFHDYQRLYGAVGLSVDVMAIKMGIHVGRALQFAACDRDQAPNKEVLLVELDNILGLVAMIASAYHLNLNDCTEKNIEKLKARYPDGFSTERSVNRAEG